MKDDFTFDTVGSKPRDLYIHPLAPQPRAPMYPPDITEAPPSIEMTAEEIEAHNALVFAEGQRMRAELIAIEDELARRSLLSFIRQAWGIVEPTVPYQENWHIEKLCCILEKVTKGELQRVLINIPPGCMKSYIVSVFWPAWEWGTIGAHLRYLTASYSQHLSTRDNLRLRSIVTSAWYQRVFPKVVLSGDQNAKTMFKTTATGWRFATSVGGAGTGEHPDRIVIDDPHSADQARSDAERQSALTWYDQTISTRGVSRGTRIIVIMQRLHLQDLSGHLLEKGGWYHVKWPMEYNAAEPDPTDPRKVDGELLWPDLFNAKMVKQLKRDLGPFATAGQLQQNPIPPGGGLFKTEWFKIITPEAANSMIGQEIRGWDTAATAGEGDYTVGVKMKKVFKLVGIDADGVEQREGPYYLIMHVKRGRWSPQGVDMVIKTTAIADGRRCAVREEKEPGSAGKAVIEARRRLLSGFDYKGVVTTGDKETRAGPLRSQFEGGNVFLVQGDWNQDYIDELSVFPLGKNDDQVDGSSCAFNELNGIGARITQRKYKLG